MRLEDTKISAGFLAHSLPLLPEVGSHLVWELPQEGDMSNHMAGKKSFQNAQWVKVSQESLEQP